jgi:hypothetical protein
MRIPWRWTDVHAGWWRRYSACSHPGGDPPGGVYPLLRWKRTTAAYIRRVKTLEVRAFWWNPQRGAHAAGVASRVIGGVPPPDAPDAPDACAGGARRRDEVQRGTTRDAWDVYPDSFQTAPDAYRPDPSEVSLHGRWSAPGMYLAAPRCAWSYLGDR